MSVELEIPVSLPPGIEEVIEQTKDVVYDLFRERLEITLMEKAPGQVFRLMAGDQAEVEILTYREADESSDLYVTVSYAPERTEQSKALCIAVAIAVAKLCSSIIMDDSGLVGPSSSVTPDELASVVRKNATGATFSEKAARVNEALSAQKTPPRL